MAIPSSFGDSPEKREILFSKKDPLIGGGIYSFHGQRKGFKGNPFPPFLIAFFVCQTLFPLKTAFLSAIPRRIPFFHFFFFLGNALLFTCAVCCSLRTPQSPPIPSLGRSFPLTRLRRRRRPNVLSDKGVDDWTVSNSPK